MSFDGGAAIGAGLIAAAVMPRRMKMNLFLMLGTMMAGNKALVSTPEATLVINKPRAYGAGAMV